MPSKYAKYDHIGLPPARPVKVRERGPLPKWVWYLAIALVVYGVWHLWQARLDYHGHVTNSPPPNASIYMLGDSMTEGAGADPGRDLVTFLSQRLHRTVTNGGVGGETTGSVLGRVPEMLKLNPGTVIISLGGNDVLKQVPVEEAERNLATIIESSQGKGAMVVLVALSGRPMDGYSSLYSRLARRYRCVLVPDVLKGIFFDARYKADQIHPNSAGYAIMADRIAQRMKRYL